MLIRGGVTRPFSSSVEWGGKSGCRTHPMLREGCFSTSESTISLPTLPTPGTASIIAACSGSPSPTSQRILVRFTPPRPRCPRAG